jgi:hypothetical protein
MNVIGLRKVESFVVRFPQLRGALYAFVARLEAEDVGGIVALCGADKGNVSFGLATCEIHLGLNLAAQTIFIREILPLSPPDQELLA